MSGHEKNLHMCVCDWTVSPPASFVVMTVLENNCICVYVIGLPQRRDQQALKTIYWHPSAEISTFKRNVPAHIKEDVSGKKFQHQQFEC